MMKLRWEYKWEPPMIQFTLKHCTYELLWKLYCLWNYNNHSTSTWHDGSNRIPACEIMYCNKKYIKNVVRLLESSRPPTIYNICWQLRNIVQIANVCYSWTLVIIALSWWKGIGPEYDLANINLKGMDP